jgi:7-carboxy-7-deazaguanine synthase
MNICEIFYSIQGESTYSGLPCVFIRTSGCNLRCSYCDTKYAYENGDDISIDKIQKEVSRYKCQLVELTGGEPLFQHKESMVLIKSLLDKGYKILLETNGSLSIKDIDPQVIKIMDLKCPDSGMSESINWDNLNSLNIHDQVKFVLSSRKDYEWAKEIISRYPILNEIEVLISTAYGKLKPEDAVKWLLEDNLKARFQLQLHKYIWHPDTRGV